MGDSLDPGEASASDQLDATDDGIFALTAVDVAEAENKVFYFLEQQRPEVVPSFPEYEDDPDQSIAAAAAEYVQQKVQAIFSGRFCVSRCLFPTQRPVTENEWREAFDGALVVAKYNLHETKRYRTTLESRLNEILESIRSMGNECVGFFFQPRVIAHWAFDVDCDSSTILQMTNPRRLPLRHFPLT
jgi:hypothetical protein